VIIFFYLPTNIILCDQLVSSGLGEKDVTARGSNRIAAVSAGRLVSMGHGRGDVTLLGSNKATTVPAALHVSSEFGSRDVSVS
jgi:hypothetical protein